MSEPADAAGPAWWVLLTDRQKDMKEALNKSETKWKIWRRADPELRMALGKIDATIAELLLLEPSKIDCAVLESLLKVDKKAVSQLGLDGMTNLMDQLDQILIKNGNERILNMELQYEYHRAPGTDLNWGDLFGDERIEAQAGVNQSSGTDGTAVGLGTKVGEGATQEEKYPDSKFDSLAKSKLAQLHWARSQNYRRYRTRQRMRSRLLWWTTGALLPLVLVLIILIANRPNDRTTPWLAATAGAIGATISGAYQLRDAIVRGNEFRAFRSALLLQPLLGAAAALFVLLILESGVISLAGPKGWAQAGTVAFVAGFSEPFFLGLIRKVSNLDEPTRSKSRS